jgi:hypothetical protein
MNNGKSEETGFFKGFSVREWLMVIVILLGLQFGSLAFAYVYKDNTDIVNIVSIAGQVASILLAIVAIVYAFFQTHAQQQSSKEAVETLARLSTVADGLTKTENLLANELKGFEQLKGEITTSVNSLRQTTEAHFTSLFNRLDTNFPRADRPPGSTIVNGSNSAAFLQGLSAFQLVSLGALIRGQRIYRQPDDSMELMRRSAENTNFAPHQTELQYMFLGTSSMYQSIGVVRINDNGFTVLPEIEPLARERLRTLTPATEDGRRIRDAMLGFMAET